MSKPTTLDTLCARPLRRRGIARLNALLDATERLLATQNEATVSLAGIAAEAGVPLPSVYHFFPNRDLAFEALALRFNEEIYNLSIRPLDDPAPQSWQELVERKHIRAAAFQNSRPAALKLFLGAGVTTMVRRIDFAGNARLALSRLRLFEAYFELPFLPDFARRIEIATAANDGIWSLSFGRHGTITEPMRAAATSAAIAYLRGYLPEYLPPRVPSAETLARIYVPPPEGQDVRFLFSAPAEA